LVEKEGQVAEAYSVVLQLGDIGHLFTKPSVSPLSDDYRQYSYTSGLEFIANELYANPSYDKVKATILLPANSMESGLDQKVKEAVKRYCRGRLKDVEHDIHATRWRGVRALLVAFVALFVFIGASRLVHSEGNLLLQIISEGLAVAGWVALWFPLEALTFKVWEHRLDRKVYNTVMDMELEIQPMV
jgi:hypothetical protein